MFANLSAGRLYLDLPFDETVRLAKEFGFAAVDPPVADLTAMSADARAETAARLREQGLRWGPTGVAVPLHDRDVGDAERATRMKEVAQVLADAGVDRAVTYLMPTSDEHTYRDNFAHFARAGRITAGVLRDHGVRLGLEYVGPKTFWASRAYPFVHTLRETLELIAEIDTPGVGLALDSFHWFTAHETADDLRQLGDADIVAVDLNDGLGGRTADEQLDQERALPGETGVIDLATFVAVLRDADYAGPVQLEPFAARLRGADPRGVVAEAAAAMTATIGG